VDKPNIIPVDKMIMIIRRLNDGLKLAANMPLFDDFSCPMYRGKAITYCQIERIKAKLNAF
jgi:hypothetical protein